MIWWWLGIVDQRYGSIGRAEPSYSSVLSHAGRIELFSEAFEDDPLEVDWLLLFSVAEVWLYHRANKRNHWRMDTNWVADNWGADKNRG